MNIIVHRIMEACDRSLLPLFFSEQHGLLGKIHDGNFCS